MPLPSHLSSPDLIIQDELHLITGPLGTMVGLYETAIEALCVRAAGGRIRPKIVASTATARQAQDQVQALFGRSSTQVFPPPGPDRRDSFFAETVDKETAAARMYVGVAAPGRNAKVMMRRTWVSLMSAAQRAYLDAGGDKNENNPADPYMTSLGYFNSLRELGGARRILEEEVQVTLREYGARRRLSEEPRLFADRTAFNDVVELTSRVSTKEVARARHRLGLPFTNLRERVDAAIATNMISVGLDIPRLGLMLVIGQPKAHAEYIQATSRVGRENDKPGLVITMLNVHKPRDRSHLERFRHYHETFYRSVEASSVTPFSARALDRGLAGALVGWARQSEPRLTPPDGAERVAGVREAVAAEAVRVFAERVRQQPMDADDQAQRMRSVQDRILELLDAWGAIAQEHAEAGARMQYQSHELSGPRPLLHNMLDEDLDEREALFRANRSLRDVEPEVNVFLRDLGAKEGAP